PNTAAHAELIQTCYRQVEVDPRKIHYIEAQGMGNPVADVEEWKACNWALQALAKEHGVTLTPGTCRISTLKPMTGHMHSTSALGALFKIIRSFQTHTIHKILNFTEIHPDLDTENQPCRLATKTEPWQPEDTPRLAGLHSYGLGGNNAHLLIEEYQPKAALTAIHATTSPQIVVFSAKSPDRLHAVALQMFEFIEIQKELPLENFAYTLQVGREAMEFREAMVVKNREELIRSLKNYLSSANRENTGTRNLLSGKADETELQVLLAENNFEKLAHHWKQGGKIPWESLHQGKTLLRMSLPTYPFATERYWVRAAQGEEREATREKRVIPEVAESTVGTRILQPYWKEQAIPGDASDAAYARHVVILCQVR